MLQCVAVCCSVLQYGQRALEIADKEVQHYGAVCCSVLQFVAVVTACSGDC